MNKRFVSSFVVAIFGMLLAFYLGGFAGAYVCVLLSILEVSLSFDNAVVNAKILNNIDKIWQDRFIYFGIPIAVFGMRFVFPVLIVAVATQMGFMQTLNLAIYDANQYHEVLKDSKNIIYSFGGSFLLMVFLDFFFSKKEYKWIGILEDNIIINKISKVKYISFIIAFFVGAILYLLTKDMQILTSFSSAIFLYFLISLMDYFFSTDNVKSGLMAFIYLEVLDASFSFDGVIGAFALSNNIFIIMIGLGVGAMFVRSLTLYLVDKKSLQKYVFIEHGAHYAIFFLAFIMIIELFYEVSEIITGTIGAGMIILSFLSSIRYNKNQILQKKE